MKSNFFGTICVLSAVFVIFISVPCFSEEASDTADLKETWKEIGREGKEVLKETGEFLGKAGKQAGKDLGEVSRQLGKQISEAARNSLEVKCYGEWTFSRAGSKTSILCEKGGNMEISRRNGFDTYYWKGTYTAAPHTIVFSITESGHDTLFTKERIEKLELWILTYSVSDDGSVMEVLSKNIPADKSGTDFSDGVLFEKK